MMTKIDTALTLKQSILLLLILPIAIGFVSRLFGDPLVSGVLSGFLMAIIILLFYYWSDLLGNPE